MIHRPLAPTSDTTFTFRAELPRRMQPRLRVIAILQLTTTGATTLLTLQRPRIYYTSFDVQRTILIGKGPTCYLSLSAFAQCRANRLFSNNNSGHL
jgi:hypothetical protein